MWLDGSQLYIGKFMNLYRMRNAKLINIFFLTLIISGQSLVSVSSFGQIIADHTVVDRYDDIPQQYIDEVKKMWFVIAGQSHASAYTEGLRLLYDSDPGFPVGGASVGEPHGFTDAYLRASESTWGNYSNETGWQYSNSEEDWWTNDLAVSRVKAGITYCNTHDLTVSVIGFGWSYEVVGNGPSAGVDPVYGVHWYGNTIYGPEGDRQWGLDAEDYPITGNSLSMDTYLNVMQEYVDYCSDSINTTFLFTTGPVDQYSTEAKYQAYLKYEHIRDFIGSHPDLVLFDYADILCHDDDGSVTTETWNGHEFPTITPTNLSPISIGHISDAGAIRIAKALWWTLARIAGWDGSIAGEDVSPPTVPAGLSIESFASDSISLSWGASTDNTGVTAYNIYRDGLNVGQATSLNYTDYNVSGCSMYTYTVTAIDAAGNESAGSQLLVINNCPPDLTPTMVICPNIIHGMTSFDIIIKITELNLTATTGELVIRIPVDPRWELSPPFNSSLTLLNGIELDNSDWTYTTDGTNHDFISNVPIVDGGQSAIGFTVTFNPDINRGDFNITARIESVEGGETRTSNNSDSERLDYFQQ